jgi:hypothetical protein
MKKKPYFPCKVLEAKIVDREDAFKFPPGLLKRKAIFSLLGDRC